MKKKNALLSTQWHTFNLENMQEHLLYARTHAQEKKKKKKSLFRNKS